MSRLFAKNQFPEEIDLVFSAYNRKNCGAIYIGNIEAARNLDTLKKLGIKAVISAAKGGYLPHPKSTLPNYLYLPAEDNESFNLAAYFQKTYSFIDKNLNTSNVLVHCAAGVSRSASIVIAFIMRYTGAAYSEAMARVRVKRPAICPNAGFVAQLKVYERELKGLKSIQNLDKEKKAEKETDGTHQTSQPSPENQPQIQTPITRGKSLLNFSTKRLDDNIQQFKERCEKFEASCRKSKPKRYSASINKKGSAPVFKALNLIAAMSFDKVAPSGLLQYRSKTQDAQELSNYINNLH